MRSIPVGIASVGSGVGVAQVVEGQFEGFQAKISVARGAIQPVQKGREVNELRTVFHEVEIEDLLSCHSVESLEETLRLSTNASIPHCGAGV
jgi:hypothetical protein